MLEAQTAEACRKDQATEKGKHICKYLSNHFPNFIVHYVHNTKYSV